MNSKKKGNSNECFFRNCDPKCCNEQISAIFQGDCNDILKGIALISIFILTFFVIKLCHATVMSDKLWFFYWSHFTSSIVKNFTFIYNICYCKRKNAHKKDWRKKYKKSADFFFFLLVVHWLATVHVIQQLHFRRVWSKSKFNVSLNYWLRCFIICKVQFENSCFFSVFLSLFLTRGSEERRANKKQYKHLPNYMRLVVELISN